MKRILVLAESIDVEDSSGSKANVALIISLREAGFALKVYHYTRKEIKIPGVVCIGIKENRRSFLFFLSRLERYIRYLFGVQLNKHLEKIFGFSFTLFNDRNSIVNAIKGFPGHTDFILTLSKGGSFRPHHALLKLPEFHERWIAYIHDPYPMHLYPRPFAWVEPGYFKKWKFIKEVSEKAKYSAFPSQLLLEWMGSYFPSFLRSGTVIPHQIDLQKSRESRLPEYFKPEKFNILHAGTLLGPRNPEFLIRGFKKFLSACSEASKDARLLFVGSTIEHKSTFEEFHALINEGILLVEPPTQYSKVRQMQEQTAVNVILEAKSEISPFLPGKFPHCVQSDRVILLLGPELSESHRLLGKKYPYWSEVDDIERIAQLFEVMFIRWKGKENFCLNREDLKKYLSVPHLKKVINSLGKD